MVDDESAAAAYPIRAVDRVCDILDVLQRSGEGISLTSLTAAVSMPKSTVLRYLSVLEARQYVSRDAVAGTYSRGLAFRPEQSQYIETLRERSLPHLLKLRDHFGETVNLGILNGTEIVHIEVAESLRSVRLAARRGDRAPLHSTAIGKAIATLLPEGDLRKILDSAGMPAITANTITAVDDFLAEVKITADRGYGLDDCENQPDGRCIAVCMERLAVPAAVSVSAPASRFGLESTGRVAKQLRKGLTELDAATQSIPH